MTENEAIRDLQYLIEEYSAYPPETGVSATVGSLQYCISALKEVQQYREIGTVEECRKAMANKKKCEKQWHNDMENPLEPIKVYSALKSEILKLELRIKNRPKDISILDYTTIAALQKVLKNNLEGMEDE